MGSCQCRSACGCFETYGRRRKMGCDGKGAKIINGDVNIPLPMLTTKVPGMGGTSIHSPERFWTWRPGWGDAWRSFRDDQACDTACIDRRAAYECEEASIVVRTDTLICGRPIVGRVLDNLEACLCMRISCLRCDLTFARCCINSSAS